MKIRKECQTGKNVSISIQSDYQQHLRKSTSRAIHLQKQLVAVYIVRGRNEDAFCLFGFPVLLLNIDKSGGKSV